MTIVVGVGSGAGSVAALRWAVAEAALRGTVVEAVHAWHAPYAGGGAPPDEVALESAARRALDTVVDAAVAGAAADAEVTRRLVRGVTASALLDAGRHADVLVLGGGGAVTRQVLAHAPCPVVVVPP